MALKYALRRLATSPVFVVTACVSLALGIGANTAAFSVVHAVLLRALPVRDAASLAVVSTRYTGFKYSLSYPAYTYLRDHSPSVDGLVAFRAQPVNVTAGGATERVTGMLVSGNYFDVLGIGMTRGSSIGTDDDRVPGSGGARGFVAVLSHQYWKRRFNGDAAVVGSSVRINGQPFTIVGVAPPQFRGTRVGSLPDVFVPMMFAPQVYGGPDFLSNPRNNWLRIIARTKRGMTLAQTQAGMTAAFRQFYTDLILPVADTDATRRRSREALIVLEPGHTGLLEMGDTVKPTLFALTGLVALVLLIACVNVANLMVARAERAHRETAIAMALGASSRRVWAQSLAESLIIVAGGVTLGIIVAILMRGLLLQLVPDRQELDISMDAPVFAAAVVLGLLTTIGLTWLAARQSLRVGVIRALKGEDVAATLWVRKGLIVAQLALSIVVLVVAALFTQTVHKMRLVNPGFEQDRVLIASTATDGYTADQRRAFYARLLDSVRGLPGVVSAALASDAPLEVNTGWNILVQRDGPGPPRQAGASVAFISPDYFKTMGIALVRGRDFDERDGTSALRAVIVNENFVRSYLPSGRDPIGALVVGNGNMTFEIVGVVKDSASIGLRDLDQHMLYVPRGQGVLHVRSAVAPASLRASVEAVVRRLDPNVPVFNVRTIDEQIDRSMRTERTFAMLSSTFGILALVLSAVGLYGVIASAVSRRRKELGIRMALGAEPRRILRLVLGEAGRVVALGIAVGLPSAWLTGRAIGSLLFGVQSGDWRSVAAALGVLMSVAALAGWIPARRASRVDPMVALRSE
ncbi:MAG TPA: ABC transporter permease [Vicinamibacterales bacterium]|nr:ABC transporter permease [Vicinamibacterales bacterium]